MGLRAVHDRVDAVIGQGYEPATPDEIRRAKGEKARLALKADGYYWHHVGTHGLAKWIGPYRDTLTPFNQWQNQRRYLLLND